MSKIKNPYADADGRPLEGKEPEFFEWAREQFNNKLEGMPAEERKEHEEAYARLADRMNS